MGKFWVQPSFRGLAYLAAGNFLARIILFLDKLANSFFSYEMVLLYSAHLDTHILLFFQAVFMIPVAFLGLLVFYGVEKQSFNLVLYPTLMLLFLILLRYGAEAALITIHWEDHCLDRGPNLVFYFVLDLVAIIVLLIYIYVSLAAPTASETITPSRMNSLRRRLQRLHNFRTGDVGEDLEAAGLNSKSSTDPLITRVVGVTKKKKKPPAPPPEDVISLEEALKIPPPRPPPSPKFNYKLRRNVAHLEKDEEKVQVQELDKQRLRNSQILQEDEEGEKLAERDTESPTPTFTLSLKKVLPVYENEPKRRSLLFETDLDEVANSVIFQGKSGSRPITPEVKASSRAITPEVKPEVKASSSSPQPPPVDPTERKPSPLPPVENDISDQNCKPEVEDDDEWEYEYEVEDDPENNKADEQTTLLPEEENKVKAESSKTTDEEIFQHEPETTISDKGFKTTAV